MAPLFPVILSAVALVAVVWALYEAMRRAEYEEAAEAIQAELQGRLEALGAELAQSRTTKTRLTPLEGFLKTTTYRRDLVVGLANEQTEVLLRVEFPELLGTVIMQPNYARMVATALVHNADLCETRPTPVPVEGDLSGVPVSTEEIDSWMRKLPVTTH
jgi:cbb3-type cytochrome oxidase subunit 3